MDEPRLRYVRDSWAYFLADQRGRRGDDWNDAPHDCNAGAPYDYVFKVAFDGDLDVVGTELNGIGTGRWGWLSVEQINAGEAPWLVPDPSTAGRGTPPGAWRSVSRSRAASPSPSSPPSSERRAGTSTRNGSARTSCAPARRQEATMSESIVADSYKICVQAPDVVAGQTRPWFVRAFRFDDDTPIATSEHYDIELACADVFAAVRLDIGRRMDRGIQAGVCDAIHNGDGSETHRGVATEEGLTSEQVTAWCKRCDELLAERPQVNAHQLRNMAGEFAFSPATCPLCKELAELEVQARDEVLVATNTEVR